jgi:hypothetical protein
MMDGVGHWIGFIRALVGALDDTIDVCLNREPSSVFIGYLFDLYLSQFTLELLFFLR